MNYENTYRQIVAEAKPSQIEQATQWYADAEAVAHEIVDIYKTRNMDVSLEQAASIVSAFSPRQRWSVNVRQALRFAHGDETMRCLPNNLKMAKSALENGFNALNGKKTNSFARNIAGDENAITIDIWMMRSVGIAKSQPSKKDYTQLSEAIEKIAMETAMTPRTVQALVWIVYRGSAA
jgi:thermostable 8-oxoguanine DNA glycosylase